MSSTRAVLCGYYGMGNGGDEALLMSLLQMLPDSVEPIILSGNPEVTKRQYGIPSYRRKSAFTILKLLKQSDVFIWGGGSLMQDSTSMASPIYYAGLMALAQQQGLTTIAWAQGIGPLDKPFTRWLTKQVLLGCSAISVRDQASAKLLREWKIEPILAPDPVWVLNSSDTSKLDLPQSSVAVVLRSHPLLTQKRLQTLIQALVIFQAQTDTHILLIPFQPIQDRAIAQQVASELGEHQTLISLENPQELKGVFKQVKMVIGMRLHSLIMAAAESCNCFALSYDPKVSQLMTEISLPGYELAALPQDAQVVCQKWLKHYRYGATLNNAQIQSLIERASIHQKLLKTAIIDN